MENKNIDFDLNNEVVEFPAYIKIEPRISKDGNTYQIMCIMLENAKTGEFITIHEVYIKENLRQIISFMLDNIKR